MKKLLFASLLALAFFAIQAGSAQQPETPGEAVWAVDFVKVKSGMFEQTMTYLDYGWVPAREEAMQEGTILNYHRIAEQSQKTQEWDILLMTQYRNQAAYDARESAFAPLLAEVLLKNRSKLSPLNKKDLYDIVDSRVLHDFSGTETPHYKLLGKP
jgi:hypothetical protein